MKKEDPADPDKLDSKMPGMKILEGQWNMRMREIEIREERKHLPMPELPQEWVMIKIPTVQPLPVPPLREVRQTEPQAGLQTEEIQGIPMMTWE